MSAFEVGQRVVVTPEEPVLFSMRELLRRHGKITGTIAEDEFKCIPDARFAVLESAAMVVESYIKGSK